MRRVTRREVLRGGFAASALLASGGELGCGTPEARAPRVPRLALSYGSFAMGIQSFSLRHYTLDAALDIVQALGLAHVELIPDTRLGPIRFGEHLPVSDDGPAIDAALAACARRGIAIAAHGVNGVRDAAAARALFRFAERARIPLLTISPSKVALAELDVLCAAHPRVKLAIHNHGPYLPWESLEQIVSTLKGRPANFGACVDTGHFIRSGVDPVEAIRRLGARVHGVHLKDFVSEGMFADGCILGAGKLELGAVFAALRAIGFAGALSLEYEEHSEHVVPDLVRCLEAASAAAERVAEG